MMRPEYKRTIWSNDDNYKDPDKNFKKWYTHTDVNYRENFLVVKDRGSKSHKMNFFILNKIL